MSIFWLTTVVMLIIAVSLFVVPVLRGDRAEHTSRDALNKAFYHHRLGELEQDEDQGVVDERPQHIRELQENLLSDIPEPSSQTGQPITLWMLVPGIFLLVLVTLGFYLYTGGLGQVRAWHQVMDRMPDLRHRLADEHSQPLTMMDVQDLGLGLRTDLQKDPSNAKDWMMLGRVGMALNNASTATQAFAHAYQLSPNDMDIKYGYADVLTRSADPQDNISGGKLLRSMLEQNQGQLRVLSLLAYNEFEQGHYPQAIGAWQLMLKILPAGDQRGDMVRASIEQAKAKSGQDRVKLAVNVDLSAEAKRNIPQQGAVFISVTDGSSPVPVAVKQLPLSRFPLAMTMDDSSAMMPERLLSSLHQLKVRVRISQNSLATPVKGDWYGDSPLTDFSGNGQVSIEINQQVP
ncbi:c-type cytochrome biogenesis protein CcmI [Hafnia psychrotolerans]|uniref:C-type cytochrome biogenesis protein CcmI n=1 Tax=Hafnia psychrotolerans TaxID=1477018 RepID=A0ABQ1H0W3_9GAMM|nr:c-type cytochrome biogenesis protein CcmI [Hafnia psychrotolerans]GGA53794.1 c-type cytochrome biogenesis protein CcmI [Hafnia psychrotolerans]